MNCTCIFIEHRYFKNIDRTLKNNIDYLIFNQLDKNELNMLYEDINLNISLKDFQNINNDLKRYEFIMIDKYNDHEFMRIRKNFDQIYIPKKYIMMINGMNIFYGSKTGSGLKVASTNKGKELEPVQTKKGKGCNKKCNKNNLEEVA